MKQTFETMNWESEAKRVAAAFGVEGECTFFLHPNAARSFQVNKEQRFEIAENLLLEIAYNKEVRWFVLWDEDELNGIGLTYDGEVRGKTLVGRYGFALANALFHLGLLTGEVERELKVSISAHQKLEWTLEYEARYGL